MEIQSDGNSERLLAQILKVGDRTLRTPNAAPEALEIYQPSLSRRYPAIPRLQCPPPFIRQKSSFTARCRQNGDHCNSEKKDRENHNRNRHKFYIFIIDERLGYFIV